MVARFKLVGNTTETAQPGSLGRGASLIYSFKPQTIWLGRQDSRKAPRSMAEEWVLRCRTGRIRLMPQCRGHPACGADLSEMPNHIGTGV
jgi:hypothetical protein